MHVGKYKYWTPKQPMVGEPGNATTQSNLVGDVKVYVQAVQDVRDIHGKITQSVRNAYKQFISSINKYPGKRILFSYVIGVGLVIDLRSYVQSRFTRPMVEAFSVLLCSFSKKRSG